jgi:hypothetical protein
MKLTIFAIVAISVYIGSFTAIMSMQSVTLTAFAARDKCISGQSADGSVAVTCVGNKKDPGLSGENKKLCREEFDKCSSSQTGFGEFGNFNKPNK